jgi:hypothetical protein
VYRKDKLFDFNSNLNINFNLNLINSNIKMSKNVNNVINNSNFNLIIGDYNKTMESLRGLSGAENYVRQPSDLEMEEEEELLFCGTQLGNLEFVGGGRLQLMLMDKLKLGMNM